MSKTIAMSNFEFGTAVMGLEAASGRIAESKGEKYFHLDIGQSDCESIKRYQDTVCKLEYILERYSNLLKKDVPNLKAVRETFLETDKNISIT